MLSKCPEGFFSHPAQSILPAKSGCVSASPQDAACIPTTIPVSYLSIMTPGYSAIPGINGEMRKIRDGRPSGLRRRRSGLVINKWHGMRTHQNDEGARDKHRHATKGGPWRMEGQTPTPPPPKQSKQPRLRAGAMGIECTYHLPLYVLQCYARYDTLFADCCGPTRTIESRIEGSGNRRRASHNNTSFASPKGLLSWAPLSCSTHVDVAFPRNRSVHRVHRVPAVASLQSETASCPAPIDF